ncbi:MAG: helix-turn-helix domain-containing protein [Bacteroides sp.]|nr:helix-turn-helix domain-containing protein [Bacteroides sp.]
MTLGERIQLLRKQRKMSQEELGEKLEVTRQTVSKWELDQSTPDLDYIISISEFFDVTTDYLIKGEEERGGVSGGISAVLPAPQLQYCENEGERASQYKTSSSGTVTLSFDSFVIKLNLKSFLRNLSGLALMFVGFMGAFACIGFMVQPYQTVFSFAIYLLLFLLSAAVFIKGLSAFANALLRYSEATNRLWLKIVRFISDFCGTFRELRNKRGNASATAKVGAPEAFAVNPEKSAAAAAPDGNKVGSPAKKKVIGALMILFSCIFGCMAVTEIAHYYDLPFRGFFGLICEILFLLADVAVLCAGIAFVSRKGAAERRTSPDNAETASEAPAEGAEKKLSLRCLAGILLILLSTACAFIDVCCMLHFFGAASSRHPLILLAEVFALLICAAVFICGKELALSSSEAFRQKQAEKAAKITETAQTKAAEIKETYRLKAEALAPDDEAYAEKIIARGEALAEKVIKKAEKRLRRYTADNRSKGGKEKGAHLR